MCKSACPVQLLEHKTALFGLLRLHGQRRFCPPTLPQIDFAAPLAWWSTVDVSVQKGRLPDVGLLATRFAILLVITCFRCHGQDTSRSIVYLKFIATLLGIIGVTICNFVNFLLAIIPNRIPNRLLKQSIAGPSMFSLTFN